MHVAAAGTRGRVQVFIHTMAHLCHHKSLTLPREVQGKWFGCPESTRRACTLGKEALMRKLLPPNKKLITRRNALKIGALAAPAIFLPQNALVVKANLLGAASDDPLFNKPYSPQSPFNAKPVHPVLGSTGIPIGPAKPRVANFPI